MRTARVVGLSQDGTSVIVTTDLGEELAIAADARLRAAVRGDRPQLGQLEFEMETSLSPRDIQTRIRGGATVDELARVAGMGMERVERFAAPVLAEREYVATTAMSSSVRRRGETSGHRNLRITVTERLLTRGVDIDTIDWDSFRLEDGRWTITADYRSGETARHAEFAFDPRGRFSVAVNDEARWLLSEQSAAKGPQPGRRPPVPSVDGDTVADPDSEPTLDLNDELALVRATQEAASAPPVAYFDQSQEASEPTIAVVRPLHRVADLPPQPVAPPARASEDDGAEPPEAVEEGGDRGVLDQMLDGDSSGQDPVPRYAGLSDAAAVPETPGGEWEPAAVVDYPVEPSEVVDHEPEPEVADAEPAAGHSLPGRGEPGPSTALDDRAEGAEEEHEFELEAAAPVAEKPAKRRRASVPSWDEIMFGGPRPSS